MTWIFSESAPAGLVSVGPAYRMAARRLIPNEWFVKVYEPVIFVGESVPGLHGALTIHAALVRSLALGQFIMNRRAPNELRILAARGTKHRKSRKSVPPRQFCRLRSVYSVYIEDRNFQHQQHQ